MKAIAMARFRSLPLSLRTRFTLGLGAVLLPFLLAAAVGLFYLLPRLVDPLEDIVREVTEEMNPVMHLQADLLTAAMPVNDYLVNGDPGELMQFIQLSRRVELAFKEAAPERLSQMPERELIVSARGEWQQARQIGEALLHLRDPIGDPQAAQEMKRFDAHVYRSVGLLEQIHDISRRTIDADRATARVTRTRSILITFGAFTAALAISLLVSATLARSVLAGVDALRQGAARLAAGELSHRVILAQRDELGELATAFNAMAEGLEQNQKALYELATRDGLTGLYNHQTFYALLADELARAQRFKRPVALLMLDIDHFKRVNDTHGHQAGDAILKGLSELLNRQARAIDRVCRYGGEEIAVILPETDPDTAANIAERLRASVEAQPFDINTGAPVRITVSIGVASWPLHGDGADTLVAAADAALYAAKRSGRNRINRYEPMRQG
ncbi:MAG: diguanylate cyclase [Thiobacillus sp.]|nr:diguanylate cyclase [Thiobacillus sp.]